MWAWLSNRIYQVVARIVNFRRPDEPPADAGTPYTSPRPSPSSLPVMMLALSNVERGMADVPRLVLHAKLTEAAQHLAQQIAATGNYDNKAADESLRSAGYNIGNGCELIGCGFTSAREFIHGIAASDPHRELFFDDQYKDVGFGMAVGPDGVQHWLALLSAESTGEPSVAITMAVPLERALTCA